MKKKLYNAGKKFGERIFFENIEKYGSDAVLRIEKTKLTCLEYYSNMKLYKTSKGVKLTKDKRTFYKGMYDFLNRPRYN